MSRCLVSANRHLDHYTGWGVPVLPDQLPDHLPPYPGPLAGFLTGLTHCSTPWLLTVPCDSPFFPHDLAQRLAACAHTHHARLVSGRGPGCHRPAAPPAHLCLAASQPGPQPGRFLQQGGHKIGQWAQEQGRILCPFDQATDHPLRSFVNINTLAELQTLE